MPKHPWTRRPNESSDSYDSFVVYRDLGPRRSIELASRKCGKNASILGRWSTRFGWVARSLAWDDFLQDERDRVAVQEARTWERRRRQALDANWTAAQKLRAKLDRMLEWPIAREKRSKDGQTIIIEPVRWSFQTAVSIAQAAAELEQVCLLAATKPLETCTDAELWAIETADVAIEDSSAEGAA